MSNTVIKVDNISKYYRLGVVNTGTLKDDLRLRMAKMRGKESDFYKIGEDRSTDSDFMWALNDVSFEVKQGEVLGIVGKNGAGKSTLLKILSRVTAPTSGNIKVKGRIASLLEVGTGFHPELTGRENIFLNGAILGMSKQEIKSNFDEIVDFSGVERYIDTPVKRYSSGMYVRLAFAVAAHLEPEILIVDEVLAVGDAEFQAKCLGKMKDVSGQGRTVLFVSHSMAAVKKLCTRAIVLKKGKITLDSDVISGIEDYLNTGVGVSDEGIIPDNASSYTTGDAKFKSIVVKNKKNESTNTLYYEQAFTVELELELFRDVEKAIIDFSIGNFENRFSYTSTFEISKNPIDLKKGTYTLSIDIDPKLLPGNYNFYLGVHEMSKVSITLDMVERIKIITVLPITENNNIRYPLDVSLGNIRIDGNWKINKQL